jgi:hypothetical protein
VKSRDKIYRLEVAIKNLSPTIWRDIVVPGHYSLRDLHLVLQSAMGWENCHRHAFALNDDPFSLDDAGSTENEEYEVNTKISDLLKKTGLVLRYLYDFNDNWEHTVTVKTIYKRNPRHFYPDCVGGEMACPPEDIGGGKAYRQLLKAIINPDDVDEESLLDKDLITWYSDYKADFFSLNECNERLKLWDTWSWGTDFGLDLKDVEEDDDADEDDNKTVVHEEVVELDDDTMERMEEATRKVSLPPAKVVMYDPAVGADFGSWLDMSEEGTILATKKYHDDHEPMLDKGSAIIHAAMHAVIETQIAMIDPPQVHRTFTKLVDAGLNRHHAIHVVGAVLAEQLYHLMDLQKSAQYNPYGRSLAELDIAAWKKYYDALKDPSTGQKDDAKQTRGTTQIHSDDIIPVHDEDQADEPNEPRAVDEPSVQIESAEQDETKDSMGDLSLDLNSEAVMAFDEDDALDESENSVDDLKLDLDSEAVTAFDEDDALDESENSVDDLKLDLDSEAVTAFDEDDALGEPESGVDNLKLEIDTSKVQEETANEMLDSGDDAESGTDSETDSQEEAEDSPDDEPA